jgi:MFS family permease
MEATEARQSSGDVTRLLMIATLNPLANGLLLFGLPWIALDLGRSVAEAAALSIVSTITYLIVVAPSSAMGDRIGRRRALRFSVSVEAAMATIAFIAILDGVAVLPLLVGLSLALGAGSAVGITSTYAATAALVDAERIPLAFAHLTVGRQIGIFGGPALGGVIYGLGHTTALMAAVVIVCGLAWFMTMTLQSPYRMHSGAGSWWQRVRAMLGDFQIRVLLAAGFVWNLPAAGALSLAVPLMHDRVHLSSLATSLVLGAGAVGSMAVAPMMHFLGTRVDQARVLVLGMVAQSAMLIALSTIVSLAPLIPIYGLMMMSNTTVASSVLTARSQRVPLDQQATVVGLGMFINMFGYLVGGGFGALLARGLAMPTIYLLLGISMMACALLVGLLLRSRPAPILSSVA